MQINVVSDGDKAEQFLFIGDDGKQSISKFELSSNGVYVSGTHVLEIPYPEQMIVFQVGMSHEAVFFSSTSGIHEVGQIDPLQQIHQIHQGNIRGLLVSTDCLVYVDGDTRQVKMINRHSPEISHI